MLGLALAYGGIAQFAAGHVGVRQGQHVRRHRVLLLRRLLDLVLVAGRDTTSAGLGPDGDKAVGAYLLAWAIFTAYMTVAAIAGQHGRADGVRPADDHLRGPGDRLVRPGVRAAGSRSAAASGLLTALAAWYASFAGVTAFTFGPAGLPVGRRASSARTARDPSRPDQRRSNPPDLRWSGAPAARDAERRRRVVSDETLSNLLHENRRFEPPEDLAAHANVKADAYDEADADRLAFWAKAGRAADLGHAVGPRSSTGTTPRSPSGSSAASSTWRTTASTGTSRPATATRSPSTGRASPGRHPRHHLRRPARTRSARRRTR